MRHHSPGTHYRIFPDGNTTHEYRTTPDRGTLLNYGWYNVPVGLCLEAAVGSSSWPSVVDKYDSMTNEHFVFDRYCVTDKRVRRDFAARTDEGVFLNLNERADFAVLSDGTTVEVDNSV